MGVGFARCADRNRSSTHTAAGAQPPKENPNPVLYRFTLWHICRIHAHFQLTELGGVARALTVRPSTLTVQWLSASPSGHFHQTSQTFIACTSTATPNFLVENLVKKYQQQLVTFPAVSPQTYKIAVNHLVTRLTLFLCTLPGRESLQIFRRESRSKVNFLNTLTV